MLCEPRFQIPYCQTHSIRHYIATIVMLLFLIERCCVVVRLQNRVSRLSSMHYICLNPLLVSSSPYGTRRVVPKVVLDHPRVQTIGVFSGPSVARRLSTNALAPRPRVCFLLFFSPDAKALHWCPCANLVSITTTGQTRRAVELSTRAPSQPLSVCQFSFAYKFRAISPFSPLLLFSSDILKFHFLYQPSSPLPSLRAFPSPRNCRLWGRITPKGLLLASLW